jgi:hypothetical protein
MALHLLAHDPETDGPLVLGDAVLGTLRDYGDGTGFTSILDVYNLLADPATQVHLSTKVVAGGGSGGGPIE